MHIITTYAQSYTTKLARALMTSPASFDNWLCLHYELMEGNDETTTTQLLTLANAAFKDTDGYIICPDALTILMVVRGVPRDKLSQFVGTAAQALPDQLAKAISIYDMFTEWRAALAVLVDKGADITITEHTVEPPPMVDPFQSTDALETIFKNLAAGRRFRTPITIMLVEDDTLTRRAVGNLLKQDYALVMASTATEAVANYMLHAPDIVFLDIGLPDHSGFSVLTKLRACDPHAYIVMFSSNSYLENVIEALDMGANGFVSKPFKKETMQHYISDYAVTHGKWQ